MPARSLVLLLKRLRLPAKVDILVLHKCSHHDAVAEKKVPAFVAKQLPAYIVCRGRKKSLQLQSLSLDFS